ncbi:unnamed protein product [Amoebophrya sp. A25]|nr:unnamed protein product [Amoebophrya sp. A25]|eukprot:GSA25T00008397001.1
MLSNSTTTSAAKRQRPEGEAAGGEKRRRLEKSASEKAALAELIEIQAEIQALEERAATEQITAQQKAEDGMKVYLLQRSLALRQVPQFWRIVFQALKWVFLDDQKEKAGGCTSTFSTTTSGEATRSTTSRTSASPLPAKFRSPRRAGASTRLFEAAGAVVAASSITTSSSTNGSALLAGGSTSCTTSRSSSSSSSTARQELAASVVQLSHGVTQLQTLLPSFLRTARSREAFRRCVFFSPDEVELLSSLREVYLLDNEDENGSHTYRFEFSPDSRFFSEQQQSNLPTNSAKNDANKKATSTGGTSVSSTTATNEQLLFKAASSNSAPSSSMYTTTTTTTSTSVNKPVVVIEKRVLIAEDHNRVVTVTGCKWVSKPGTASLSTWLDGSAESGRVPEHPLGKIFRTFVWQNPLQIYELGLALHDREFSI